jgi:mannose-6-phosphate isomerase-like protein (cupin superfamily)
MNDRQPPATFKVIRTQEFVRSASPAPGERQRVQILSSSDHAGLLAGIFGSIPPAQPGETPSYHFHRRRESIIQILSGDGTEMVEGNAVPLAPGDVIYLPPNVKHTLMNNSATEELRYMEFYTPTAPDVVREGE